MVARSVGPCQPWTPLTCVDIPINEASVAITGDMLEIATEILWAKSGRQFGECTTTLRPCREDCWGGSWPFYDRWNEWGRSWPYPYNWNGQWFNLGCGGCPGSCSCTVLESVKLPFPATSIVEVKVDGTPLVSGSYLVYDYETLLRVDGGTWPLCNDLNKTDDQVGTWSVTVTTGTEVPALGRLAVGELFAELTLACIGDDACKLPSPVQQLVRQGVSLTFLDPNEMWADGKIGLFNSDLFISTFNPAGIQDRARAYDVDSLRTPRRLTWPP